MQVREFNVEKDYETIASWWLRQDWPVVHVSALSPKGFIVENNSVKLAAAWVYKLQDSPWSLMEWTVGNPDANWEDRSNAINLLIEEISQYAKNDNSSYLLTMTKHQRLIDKFKNQKFEETDVDMTHLMRIL